MENFTICSLISLIKRKRNLSKTMRQVSQKRISADDLKRNFKKNEEENLNNEIIIKNKGKCNIYFIDSSIDLEISQEEINFDISEEEIEEREKIEEIEDKNMNSLDRLKKEIERLQKEIVTVKKEAATVKKKAATAATVIIDLRKENASVLKENAELKKEAEKEESCCLISMKLSLYTTTLICLAVVFMFYGLNIELYALITISWCTVFSILSKAIDLLCLSKNKEEKKKRKAYYAIFLFMIGVAIFVISFYYKKEKIPFLVLQTFSGSAVSELSSFLVEEIAKEVKACLKKKNSKIIC